jgi:two-component sensor histidine kinase
MRKTYRDFENATVLSASEEAENLGLADLIDVQSLQSLMDDFYTLTNMGSAIVDTSGTVLVATGWQEICTHFHRIHPQTRKYCIESDISLTSNVEPGTFKLYRCRNNMWDMATPITVEGRHLGNLFIGQFFFDDEVVDYEVFREQARQYGFDDDAYLKALDKVPRWNQHRVETAMAFYTKLADIISSLGYSNIQLSRAVKANQTLLKELQHRVKNSMAMIISLINLEKNRHPHEHTRSAMEEIEHRVSVLSHLYSTLYESDRFDASLDVLCRHITESLAQALSPPDVVTHTENMDSVTVDPKRASSVGLILNELLTNAYKYAFPAGTSGSVSVELRKHPPDTVVLSVTDTGVGLPETVDHDDTSGFGFLLVRALCEELDGQCRWETDRGRGVRFRIEFPSA